MLVSLPLLALYYTPNLSEFMFIPNYSLLPSLLSLAFPLAILPSLQFPYSLNFPFFLSESFPLVCISPTIQKEKHNELTQLSYHLVAEAFFK